MIRPDIFIDTGIAPTFLTEFHISHPQMHHKDAIMKEARRLGIENTSGLAAAAESHDAAHDLETLVRQSFYVWNFDIFFELVSLSDRVRITDAALLEGLQGHQSEGQALKWK